jgi:tRNA threonylcarbamoyladenosine biosynthesis protein TsaE
MEAVFTLDHLELIAQQLIAEKPNKVILFNGEMGVGKTTLIKQLCKNIEVVDAPKSPSFSLVNEYVCIDNQLVYHFDFYRLTNEMEALEIGVDEYFYSGHWCFIEWAEKIPNLIPLEHSVVTIHLLADGKRHLKLTNSGKSPYAII